MSEPRILVLDIETVPIESYHWGLWKENIGIEQVKEDWTILSFAAKWLGDSAKKVIYQDTFEQDDLRDDNVLLCSLWSLLDAADIVVAQNGVGFDLKKIRARMFINNLPPFSPVRVIDTYVVAKNTFGFTSNKLAWMTKYTNIKKLEHEKFPGFKLWKAYLEGNPAARKEMKKYNINDILATEELYLKMRPWIEGHPNVAAYDHEVGDIDGKPFRKVCPKCGSTDLEKRGYHTTQVGRYQRYKCGGCGSWPRGRQNLMLHAQRKEQLVN